MEKKIFGVSNNADLDPALIQREARPLRFRISEFVTYNKGFIMLVIGIVIAMLPIAGVEGVWMSDFLIFVGPLFYLYARKKNPKYPFRKPIQAADKIKDFSNGGLFILGNEIDTGAQVAFSNDDVRTHMLLMGSTGCGKSRFLLGLMYQAMIVGSGITYVDGKADNTVFWLVFSMCRRLGRTEDLLVINYLTSSDTKDKPHSRLSNTNNMLAQGNSEQLRSLIVGLMRSAGSEGQMWKGRASAMLKGLLNTLVYMRDSGEINLSVGKLREYMPLDQILKLYNRKDLPETAVASLHSYLFELPGFTAEDAQSGELNPEAYKQHGFLQMQLTETLSDLSDTYGKIFSPPIGETDFKDCVFNRRILFVMLPSLEKDPDALAGLGKLVVAGIRSALAPALGSQLEGSKAEVIDSKPTKSKVPYLIILDEYGYYSVEGFAVVAAQARSLGVGVVFAGQDIPSFKKGSAEECESTIANTNVKICMKCEDPKETAELFINRASDAQVTEMSGHSAEKTGSYSDTLSTRIDRRKRISVRDLVNQAPGEAHIIWKDQLSRARFFYADPEETKFARLNQFLMIDKGSESTIKRLNSTYVQFEKHLANPKDGMEVVKNDDGVIQIFKDFSFAEKNGEDKSSSARYAASMIELKSHLKDYLLHVEHEPKPKAMPSSKSSLANKEAPKSEDLVTPPSVAAPSISAPQIKKIEKKPDITVENKADSDAKEAESKTNILPKKVLSDLVEDGKDNDLVREVHDSVSEFKKLLLESKSIKLSDQVEKATSQLTDEVVANTGVDENINEILKTADYPPQPSPEVSTQDEIRKKLEGFLTRIKDESKKK